MTTKGRKYFSGNNLDNALLQAARQHGVRPEEVAYRQIEKRHGFLKARKGVLIEVDPDSPTRSPESEKPTPKPASETDSGVEAGEITAVVGQEREVAAMVEDSGATEPEAEAPEDREAVAEIEDEAEPEPGSEERQPVPATDADAEGAGIEEMIEAAERGLDEILAFAKLNLEHEVTEGEDQLDVELHGPDRDRLLEDRGNLILSIQHLLPRLIRGYTGRSLPCHVDSENYHETRRAELKQLAEEAAEEVRQRQRPRTLPPMNPAERRIIHVALADKTEVATESQGRGFFKRVTISPAMRRPRGFDRY